MKIIKKFKRFKLRNLTLALLAALAFSGSAVQVSAHGGEDHGDAKPKIAATTTAGMISRAARLGDFEIMLKHSPLAPDTAAAGRLFVTKFATNEPVGDALPTVQIESANGAITEIPVEKTDAAVGGSYALKIPALPEGAYALRVKIAAGGGGKTDTTTFSGVEVAHREAAAADAGGRSWTQTALMAMLLLVALGLFGGLAYLARRAFRNEPLGGEAVSV